jgi:hypothetical protein
LLVAGCSTVETQSFRNVESENVGLAQIAIDADFSKYDRLYAQGMGIFFPQSSTVPNEDLERIRRIFRDAFYKELDSYQIVQQPGPSTMEVQASLLDLRQSSAAYMPGLRRDVRELASPGSLVFLMEMRDSVSGRVLARAADSAAKPSLAVGADDPTDWASVEASVKRWARLFRSFLDENLTR